MSGSTSSTVDLTGLENEVCQCLHRALCMCAHGHLYGFLCPPVSVCMCLSQTLCVSVLQFTMGGFEELQEMKVRGRERLSLPPLPEDSIKVVRSMRAASPPASAMELIEQQQQAKRGRRSRRVRILPSITHILLTHCSWRFSHAQHLCVRLD